MEHIAAYINDIEHAHRTIAPLLAERAGPTRWTFVICTPRLTQRIGRFVTQRNRELWRDQWAERLWQSLQPMLLARSGPAATFEWRVAKGPLVDITNQLRQQHGTGLRVLDARRPKMGEALPSVVPEMPAATRSDRLTAPAAVTSALSVMLVLAD